MTRLPVVSGAEVVKALERVGFEVVRTKGSHSVLRDPATGRGVAVPLHKAIKRGTLAAIIRQAGLDADKLMALL